MSSGLRYETGRDMPPGMLEKVAVKLAADLAADSDRKQADPNDCIKKTKRKGGLTMREKLIKLIHHCTSCEVCHDTDIADHLIANGVTVQEWISVKDRLPEKNEMVFVFCKDKTIRGLDVRHIGSCDNGFWFLKTQPGTESFPHPEWEVTHWMPLPAAPEVKKYGN